MVEWYIPKSTRATSDLIGVLVEEHATIQDVHDNIHYDREAKAIMQKYIDAGYGAVVARTWFRPYRKER